MNKAELVAKISENVELSKSQIEGALNEMISLIRTSVKKGNDVTLVGFGTFSKAKRKARKGRNPQTGKEIKIAARNVPRFKPGTEFKQLVR